jgi:hypothetical protein
LAEDSVATPSLLNRIRALIGEQQTKGDQEVAALLTDLHGKLEQNARGWLAALEAHVAEEGKVILAKLRALL